MCVSDEERQENLKWACSQLRLKESSNGFNRSTANDFDAHNSPRAASLGQTAERNFRMCSFCVTFRLRLADILRPFIPPGTIEEGISAGKILSLKVLQKKKCSIFYYEDD